MLHRNVNLPTVFPVYCFLHIYIRYWRPDITNLATNAILNTKLNEIKGQVLSITNLSTPTALTAVGNKISDPSKCITTPEFNTLIAETLKQANLATKDYISDFVKKTDFSDKLKNSNKRIT